MPDVSQVFQDPTPYQEAISKIESGGNYGALGPATKSGDRAYGKYQIMGSNIPQWSKAALGRQITPQEFLADKAAQDAIFNHQFGGYVKQYGPQDAASMWLTGRTLANGGAKAADQNGTTGQSYAAQFTHNLGAPPAPHATTWADVEADNAQGAANIAAREAKAKPMQAVASLAPPAEQPQAAPSAQVPQSNPFASLAFALSQSQPQAPAQAPPPQIQQNLTPPKVDPAALVRALTQFRHPNLALADS